MWSGHQTKLLTLVHLSSCSIFRVEHWDVNNENLHGFWFQRQLRDLDYELELFRETHAADPHALLFLNDYGVVAGGDSTGVSPDLDTCNRSYTLINLYCTYLAAFCLFLFVFTMLLFLTLILFC